MNPYVSEVLEGLKKKYYWEKEFLQAVTEVLESLNLVIEREPRYKKHRILERITEPERVVMFRVPWQDDRGEIHVNTGYRVQFNSALGPYKGGLRFHPSVTLSGLKFLGFEQIFKNSLTGLPMGGGKGGSDFNVTGKSDNEVMRFCQSFITELHRHVGPNTDVPAGDIGVGGREIGYLFGQYKKLVNRFEGWITGKGLYWGGSLIRPEATGFGAIYFAEEILKVKKESLKDKTIALSGFGNVAWGAALKATELGAKIITISGPDGFVYDKDGISGDKIKYLLTMRASGRDMVKDYADKYKAEFHSGKRPWSVKCDIAIPCAIQNELDGEDAKVLIKKGCNLVVEASNMGCTPEAVTEFAKNQVSFAPGKAANAGGVATSGLEMSQNSMRLKWEKNEVDARLKQIMVNIHANCLTASQEYDQEGNYVIGANIAGFKKVADAMIEQGLV
ncbi:MAG: NADP-specific glutamate dehydrogenase [Spirochaetes bacterium]|nr:NADP-specific glutamate dehydrogenase [Spirochaetota bacterium]